MTKTFGVGKKEGGFSEKVLLWTLDFQFESFPCFTRTNGWYSHQAFQFMAISFDWSQTIAALPAPGLPAEWLATRGNGVKVAITDTGANLGLACLKHIDKPGRKFFTGAPGFSTAKVVGQDLVGEAFTVQGRGHGTLYTSLLAGKLPETVPPNKDMVTGLANDATFIIIKATDGSGEVTTIRHLLDALELAANLGVEVFITGQCISKSEMAFEGLTDADIERVFDLPGVKRMFVFAPLKNRKTAEGWVGLAAGNFPTLHPDVFNVAALPDIFPQVADIIRSQPISFLLAGFEGQVLSKSGDAVALAASGTGVVEFSNSGAAAIMGGIAALALSFFKQKNNGALPGKLQFAELLASACHPLDDAFGSFDKPALFKNFNPPA
jgi:hypothetical protein